VRAGNPEPIEQNEKIVFRIIFIENAGEVHSAMSVQNSQDKYN
jgi:hypothetical protein